MHCTPPTFHLTLLSASGDSLVSVGCNHLAGVNFDSLLTPTLACSWCPWEWVCLSRPATASTSCPTTQSYPQAPPRIKRAPPAPVLPSLSSASPYCGTAGLVTFICKAYMPSIPTVSQLASISQLCKKMFLAIHACSTRPLMHPATLPLARNHPVPFSTFLLTFGV
jgi:hypothetical protein